jgi:hypothetical protein
MGSERLAPPSPPSATAHELMSIYGWLTLKEAERYTRAAEQKKIAGRAMTMLERGEKRT